VRVSAGGELAIEGGTVSSLRWVDIHEGGTVSGKGTIDSNVYNNGVLHVTGGKDGHFDIDGDYHQLESGILHSRVDGESAASVRVTGMAYLSGILHVEIPEGVSLNPKQKHTVLTAEKLSGRFQNKNDLAVAADGTPFRIRYAESSITLQVE